MTVSAESKMDRSELLRKLKRKAKDVGELLLGVGVLFGGIGACIYAACLSFYQLGGVAGGIIGSFLVALGVGAPLLYIFISLRDEDIRRGSHRF